MNINMKNFAIWALILTMFAVMVTISQGSMQTKNVTELKTSELIDRAQAGTISDVVIDSSGGNVTGKLEDGDSDFTSTVGPFESSHLVTALEESGVVYDMAERKETSALMSVFLSSLPLILIIGISIMFMRSMQGGGRGGAMNFGKSRAKLLTESNGTRTFDDVAGVEAAKEDLKEVVEFLQDPTKFKRLGAKIPTGALLVGPPGTGKTLPALTLLKCLSASVHRACVICLPRPVKIRPVLSLLMRLMRWAVTGALARLVAMRSVSRPSTSFLLKWTALTAPKVLSLLRRRTALMCSIKHYCVRAVLIAKSKCQIQMCKDVRKSSKSTCAASLWRKTW